MIKFLFLFLGCFAMVSVFPQDVIIMKSGEEIPAIVIEVGIEVIKYKKKDNQQGPTYSIAKSDVFMIKYANGTKEVFSTDKLQSEAMPEEPQRELTIYEGFWGPKVMKNGKDLTNTQVLDLMMSNNEGHAAWTEGKSTQTAGLFVGIPSASLLGWELGKTISGEPANAPVFIVGVVGTIAGSIMVLSASKKLNSAVSIYNSSISMGETPIEFNLNFGITENGFGLLLTLN